MTNLYFQSVQKGHTCNAACKDSLMPLSSKNQVELAKHNGRNDTGLVHIHDYVHGLYS